jgi:hypothetical protein
VRRERGYADRWQRTRAAALVGHRVRLADAESELRVVIEEERRDVVVEDQEQDIRLLLGQPLLHRLVSLEDWCPRRIVLLVFVEREPDGGVCEAAMC